MTMSFTDVGYSLKTVALVCVCVRACWRASERIQVLAHQLM